ncbi:SusC/RagA family TonB-linked outer membrane protein [Aquimarina sp. TRL1]|uniref:SusC/RagA family TonB-linked outer membrane protein n=1 Tax=Aquimarina sp. (strain TRL1) TaxID=2736252 RepID=UPI001588786E|nr:SusC/RagA family TonB-linked outer membrane protein [Aquimarina sp. TRL1]QKX03759.1 SusC/RagA family TonB-linked outer membrane protein [Aquimarina sp. TRL1]
MRTKFSVILTLFLAFVVQLTFAQEKTVSGVISDNNGMPLPGVNILVKGTSSGTQSDFDGNYSIEVNKGAVLSFSYIGFSTKELVVGEESTINVQLEEDAAQLDEVVVTALGISRAKKSLGYSVQEVDGSAITETRTSNALGALSGQVAGVQITNPSGSLGGSTRILVRGVGSITQGNKPLIVVDGTPLDNSNYNSENTQSGGGGRDYGDTGFDINPDDIESMSVLKGGAAAALYGSRANNGVIIITTKSAKNGKAEIVVNSGLSFESINVVPQVQKQYGGGAGNVNTIEQSTFQQQNINGTTYNLVNYATDESWGPKYDPNTLVLGWDAFDPEFAEDYLNPRPWVAPDNDAESFFDTGVSRNNSISFSKSFEDTKVRLSLANVYTTGIVPNTNLEKTSISINASSKLSERLNVEGTFNYIVTNAFNRPETGYGDNSLMQKFFQWGQTSLDYERLKNYMLADGTQRTWNRTAWDNPTPRYSDNPYWIINKNTSHDKRNRYFGNVKFKYDLTDELYAMGAIYSDSYNYSISERVAIGSQAQSKYEERNRTFQEVNYEARLHYDTSFLEDKISFNSFIGANRRNVTYSLIGGETQGGLAVDGIYNLTNSNESPRIFDFDSEERINSVYGSASIGYNRFAFLEFTGRNDWSSTLPSNNNSYFYPAVTGSLVLSELVKTDWLSFAKVRGSWASVGNDTAPYDLANTYGSRVPFNGGIRFTQPDENKNPDLKPETKNTWEVGLEAALLNNRLRFDITYYDEITKDLITPIQIDPSTGYTATVANAGKMSNKGLELLISGTPIETKDFSWDITWNFAKNENELLELKEGVETLELARFPFKGVTLNAVVGESYGIIRGTDFIYDENGNKVVGADGRYLSTNEVQNLGSVLPDYNMGIRNKFRYKNIDFGFLIDVQKGGVYRSLTNMWGHYSGILESTAANGIRETGTVLDAVTGTVTYNEDGTYTVSDTSKNTTVISAQRFGQDHYYGPDAMNVFDASYIKLREVTLGYSLPEKWTGPLSDIRLSLFGRNLFVWGLDNDNFDPEVASTGSGNIQGSEGGSLPSTRNYGFNVQLKF